MDIKELELIAKEEADILAETYYHTATIIRPAEVNINGFDDFKNEEIYKDIECAVSFTQGSKEGESDTTQNIDYMAVLFTRPEIKVEVGDTVIANILGQTRTFLAGEGAPHISHWEIPLIRKDRAQSWE